MNFNANQIETMVDDHLTELAFLYQITEKDIRHSKDWPSLTLEGKLKFLADVVGGRTVGIQPFNTIMRTDGTTIALGPGLYPPTFVLGNAINKTSEIGAILWGAAELGILSSKWGTRGKKIAIGGAIGGIFDAPVPRTSGGVPERPYVSGVNTVTAGQLNAGVGGGY